MIGKRFRMVLAAVFCAALVALAWYGLYARPARQAAEEVGRIAAELSSAVTVDDFGPEHRRRAAEFVERSKPRSRAGRELLLGVRAFLADDPRAAEEHFRAAGEAAPDSPHLPSFRAAATLRMGNVAPAGDLYSQALALKRRASSPAVDVSYDQVGLALSFFMAGLPDKARSPAEEAWRVRSAELGPGAPETLSAATRLAAVYVALNENALAESLLREVLRLTGEGGEAAGAARKEAELLLAALCEGSGCRREPDKPLNRPPAGETGALSVGEAIKAQRPETATAKAIEDWERIADELAGHNDLLAAELRVRAVLGRAVLDGLDMERTAPVSARLALAGAWVDSGRTVLAEKLLRDTAADVADRESVEFIELSALLASCPEAEGRFKEAESRWRTAVEAAEARLAASYRTGSGPEAADVDRVLRLRLKLAENFLKQGQVAPEAEIELLSALARLEDLGVKNAAECPAAGLVYLRLAELVEGMNRESESQAYYRRAASLADNLLKTNPDRRTRLELRKTSERAAAGIAGAEENNPSADPDPPPADLLRLELSALSILGRIDEFQSVLDPALAEAARRFDGRSRQYLRYYSLKLKWLEESGRVEELTAELRGQAADPPGRNEAERALNRAGALIYAARVNGRAGRAEAAVELYRQAQSCLEGRTEPVMDERRRLIEAALADLARPEESRDQ